MSREVALSSLRLEHPFWLNPRQFTGLSDKDLAEFGKEIKERGVLDPPTVQKVIVDGDVVDLVIDGQRRVRAALDVLPKTTKIEVIDRTDKPIELTWDESDKIMLEVLAMGEKRKGLSSFELSEVAERMRNRERKLVDIANAIGRDESWVSKILKARSTASPRLMLAWRKGQVTDEQFKELAAVKDQGEQEKVAEEAIEIRKTGDKAEARTRIKELTEKYKHEERKAKKSEKPEPAKPNGHVTTPADGGQQVEMWKAPPPVAKKSQATPRHALEEMIALADKRAPTADYVKGLMDGVRYALGEMEPDEFGKPWRAYLARLGGTAKAKAKVKHPLKNKRTTWNAKTKKPVSKKEQVRRDREQVRKALARRAKQ
jgi:hypothetical protein